MHQIRISVLRLSLVAAVLSASLLGQAATMNKEAKLPNFLVILADDLGYSDIACYGGEIETPNLDALAAGGLRFTQFYNTGRCWPTRAALMTGYYAQQVRRDKLPGVRSGGGGVRPAWARLLPAMLKSRGFRSYHSGKWHLDGGALQNGFDRSYRVEDQDRFFHPKHLIGDGKRLPPVKEGEGYYVTAAIADHAIGCLKEHADKYADRPFFHFLAFTSPHFPLHALPGDIAPYRDKYLEGWQAVRAARSKRQREMKLLFTDLSEVERDVGPPYHFAKAMKAFGPDEVNRPLPWDELSKSQQRFQATKMAIHAAMVHTMDREIGRVIEQLRESGALENTLVLFLSDNGASAEIMVRGDGHDRDAAMGSAESYLCLGPGWSNAANTPFRRHKTWTHEGGIATPLIAHWPRGITGKGLTRQTTGHAIDIVPTILDLAGVKPVASIDGLAVPPAPGRSLVPAFDADVEILRDYLWWSHEGHRALRLRDWKLVAAKGDRWELFDLASDRAETRDVAADNPERVTEMALTWKSRRDEFLDLVKR